MQRRLRHDTVKQCMNKYNDYKLQDKLNRFYKEKHESLVVNMHYGKAFRFPVQGTSLVNYSENAANDSGRDVSMIISPLFINIILQKLHDVKR